MQYGDRAAVRDGHGARLEVDRARATPTTPDQPLLEDVTFAVEPGRTVALVGATASGKSTLTTLMTRLVDPDDGRDPASTASTCATWPAASWPTSVSVVAQTAFLFDDTVRGNVTLGADVPDEEVWAALRAAQADGFVAALPDGLDTQLGERGTSLSGGQRQRISLARALVRRPRLLILDDATSAVDPEVEARILAALRGRSTRGAHRWSSWPTARPRSGSPTRWSTSRTAGSPTAAPTPSCSAAARRTPTSSTPTSSTPTREARGGGWTRHEHPRPRRTSGTRHGHRRRHRRHGDDPPRRRGTRPS